MCLLGRGAAQNGDAELRVAFQKLYARIDGAMERQNAAGLERLIAADGRVTAGPLNVSLRGYLSNTMKVAGLSRQSEVTDVRMDGADAVVTVKVHFTVASGGPKRESDGLNRDRWVRSGEGWVCKESAGIGGEPKIRPTSAEEAKPVIAELRARAARLTTVAPGAEMDDLDAFGAAVGDARIVALGEATHGTRKFYQMNHRLVEYLVRKKGFTVLSTESNWPDALGVDRYIKSPGDAPAPTGVAEMDDLVKWMRAQNAARGVGHLLTWTGFDMRGVGAAADLAQGYVWRHAPELGRGAEDAYEAARRIDEEPFSNTFLAGAKEAERRAGEVLAQFDAHQAEWVRASSKTEWRDARHAAATVVAACAMRVEGSGFGHRDAAMARNVE